MDGWEEPRCEHRFEVTSSKSNALLITFVIMLVLIAITIAAIVVFFVAEAKRSRRKRSFRFTERDSNVRDDALFKRDDVIEPTFAQLQASAIQEENEADNRSNYDNMPGPSGVLTTFTRV